MTQNKETESIDAAIKQALEAISVEPRIKSGDRVLLEIETTEPTIKTFEACLTHCKEQIEGDGELLPCPFCGGDAFADVIDNKYGGLVGSIRCNVCDATGVDIENIGDSYATNEEALAHIRKSWNTRPALDKLKKALGGE